MEIWKNVVGFEEYFEVSNKGRVWSKRSNKILVQGKSKSGYPVISSKIGGRNGKNICKKVHRWVAEAFIDNPENLPFVNHKDGVKTNNETSNLEWCTKKQNSIHAKENGLLNALEALKGIDNKSSKLTEDEVIFIRENYIPRDSVYGMTALARKFGVSYSCIIQICNKTTWKHI